MTLYKLLSRATTALALTATIACGKPIPYDQYHGTDQEISFRVMQTQQGGQYLELNDKNTHANLWYRTGYVGLVPLTTHHDRTIILTDVPETHPFNNYSAAQLDSIRTTYITRCKEHDKNITCKQGDSR